MRKFVAILGTIKCRIPSTWPSVAKISWERLAHASVAAQSVMGVFPLAVTVKECLVVLACRRSALLFSEYIEERRGNCKDVDWARYRESRCTFSPNDFVEAICATGFAIAFDLALSGNRTGKSTLSLTQSLWRGRCREDGKRDDCQKKIHGSGLYIDRWKTTAYINEEQLVDVSIELSNDTSVVYVRYQPV